MAFLNDSELTRIFLYSDTFNIEMNTLLRTLFKIIFDDSLFCNNINNNTVWQNVQITWYRISTARIFQTFILRFGILELRNRATKPSYAQ